jgi:3-methyladenine DNA glycosylase AlkD
MKKAVRERIIELVDEEYRQFHCKIIPNSDNILGVRLPKLRKLAKELANSDWHSYLATAQDDYYEEILLQGLVIGYSKGDIEEILGYVAAFIPKISNWAVCDSCCNSLKITNKYKMRIWEFLQPYLESSEEFQLRFAIVMLLTFYIEEEYIDRVLTNLNNTTHDGYYVKMAVAWAISICFIKFPKKTMFYLQNNTLNDFTYNKALQKIIESFRVDHETKTIIRNMKRKSLA